MIDDLPIDGKSSICMAMTSPVIASVTPRIAQCGHVKPQGGSPTWPAEQAFHDLSNVLMTPHIAGGTEGTVQARVAVVADNIARIARGELPLNLVKGAE